MKQWILDRLSENSTWRGIVLLLTALGVTIEPELGEKIVACGLAIVGLINIIINRTAKPKPVEEPPPKAIIVPEP